MEIEEQASKDIKELLEELDNVTKNAGVEYEFVEIEKAESTEELLQEFAQSFKPDLLFVGMRKESAKLLSKIFLGSVSQFCVDNIECPVVVVKLGSENNND